MSTPLPGTRVIVPLMNKEVRGVVLREHTEPVEPALAAKIRPILAVSDAAPVVSPQQLALWQWMSSYYMCSLGEVMSAALPGGLDKRLINPPKRRKTHLNAYDGPVEPAHPLSPAQTKSADDIERLWTAGKQIVLQHGVTSSGKTDIYIHLIRQQLEAGKNVLYLVPEIALTTQLTTRLERIFGDKLIVYHSRFTDAERADRYEKISKVTITLEIFYDCMPALYKSQQFFSDILISISKRKVTDVDDYSKWPVFPVVYFFSQEN